MLSRGRSWIIGLSVLFAGAAQLVLGSPPSRASGADFRTGPPADPLPRDALTVRDLLRTRSGSGQVAGGRASDTPKLDSPHHPGRILVRFRAGTSVAAKRAAHDASKGCRAIKAFSSVAGLQLVEVPRDGVSTALADYLANPDVLYAEPDYRVHTFTTPNDPLFDQLWGLANDGQTVNGVTGIAGADIDARRAWDAWTGDPGFRVAILDTGIDYLHPDLAANIWVNPLEIPGNLVDDDGNGFVDDVHGYDFANEDGDPMDDNAHGTHVAGTVGAVGNNGTGISGINWSCKLVALKFLGAGGSGTTSDAIRGIQYMIDQEIRVSNNSWGSSYYSQALFDAIDATQEIDHIFVAAAGNSGANSDFYPSYPAAYDLPNVISVAATTNRDELAWFSNYGAVTVDLGAPGVGIYSTILNGQFDYFKGTSMASPHVAGVVALLSSRLPGLLGFSVKSRILDTVRPVAGLAGITVSGGVLDAFAALDDCNLNGLSDAQEIADGTVEDCTGNQVPDECEPDCNGNGVADSCDIASGFSDDCTGNRIPDECEPDCNSDGLADSCELALGIDVDCDHNGVPDGCESDCNGNGITDACDISSGFSNDCTANGIPDECEPDCNNDGVADSCGIDSGLDDDCNRNGVPDVCDVPLGDCNGNGIPDECEVDCNENGVADECDLDSGFSADCTGNGVPDECELDCNGNGSADSCDIADGTLPDSDGDGVADDCVLGVSLVPIGATGPHTINGNEIHLHEGGQNVFLEARLYGWDPLHAGAPRLHAYQFSVDPTAFDNGIGAPLRFARTPCSIDAECPVGFACPGVCSDGFCGDQSAFLIDPTHPQYVFRGLETIELTFCNLGLPPIAGALVWDAADAVGDFSAPQYGVGITVNVPADAQGTFVVPFLESQTFWLDEVGLYIPVRDSVPVVIVLPQDCNGNGVEDADDIASGTSQDCNGNGIPDECLHVEGDCNGNMIADACDIVGGGSPDLNGNGVPDECEPPRLLVDATAQGLGSGESWVDAFNELDDALLVAAASNGFVREIWVAAGTYTPTILTMSGDIRTTAFSMIDGVAIYGGFAGNESDLSQRDIAANETVFTGDLNGDDGPTPFTGIADNSYHVVVADGVDETAILDGVTLTAGNADGGAYFYFSQGGGLFTKEGNPTISRCTFVANRANSAGGMSVVNGSATILDSLFVNNRGNDTGALKASGGVTTILVDRCRFIGNTGYYFGNGGIRVTNAAEATLLNSLLSGNAGLGNAQGGTGGAIVTASGTTITLINCTVVNNSSPESPGGMNLIPANTTLINTIVWGNRSTAGIATIEDDQVRMPSWEGLTSVIGHSVVEGWTGSLGGTGNSGDDPMFADADGADDVVGTLDDDLHLTLGSAGIDAGDNSVVPICGLDLDRAQRRWDDPATADVGSGTAPITDIGAYEFGAPAGSDCNGNDRDDACEIAEGLASDCQPNGVPDECELDTDSDGAIDDCDADDDNDCILDASDLAPLDPRVCVDVDGDTCDDCAIGNDGFGPGCDVDATNDGPDADADGMCDAGDNCPMIANADQADGDADGVGDVCNDAQTPLPAPYPHGRRKNRYISFSPNKADDDGKAIAFEVELRQLTLGSCSGNGGFCRPDRGGDDCNTCSVDGNPCIHQSIDCAPVPPQTCDPTGATCINDAPNIGGSNVGRTWWVGPQSPLANGVHLMVSEAFRKISGDWPNPLHVGDCEIVPQAVYGVRAVVVANGAESDELVVETTQFSPPPTGNAPFWWGDVVGVLAFHCNADIREQTCDPNTSNGDCTGSGTPAACCTGVGTGLCDCPSGDLCERAWELPNGVTNVDDVTAALWTSAPAPPTTVSADFTWVDVHGNDSFAPGSQNYDPPNYQINVSDLQQIGSAFGGLPYKFYDPADCPDAATWP